MAAKKNTKSTKNTKGTSRKPARAKGAEAAKKQKAAEEPLSPEELVRNPKAAQKRLDELGSSFAELLPKKATAKDMASKEEISREIAAVESEINAIVRAMDRRDAEEAQVVFDEYTAKVEELVKGKLPLPPPGYGTVVIRADEEGKALLVERGRAGGKPRTAKATGARQQASGRFTVKGLGTFGSPSTAAKAAIQSVDPSNKGAVNGWVWWSISDRDEPEGVYEHTYKGETFELTVH